MRFSTQVTPSPFSDSDSDSSPQIEFSLLRMYPDTCGMLQAAKELGVTIIAFSPLGQCRLAGISVNHSMDLILVDPSKS